MALYSLVLLLGVDPQYVALATRAQTDFDRVELSGSPSVADASTCVQSQAAVLAVTAPESRPMVLYRQGHCALVGALAARDRRGFETAARNFDEAISAWAARPRDKKAAPEAAPSGLKAVAAMARLEAGPDPASIPALESMLGDAVNSAVCTGSVMPVSRCRELLGKAAAWQGWIAARNGKLDRAAERFAAAPSPAWSAWTEGRRAFDAGRYADSAASFQRAVDAWSAVDAKPVTSVPAGLDPPPDLSPALIDLAGSRLASGDPRAAIAALDRAIRRPQPAARAYYLRARAREESGDAAGALPDYNLAARTALAGGEESAPEARFYRGAWLYRRGEYGAAEEEFVEAMNAGNAPRDASAWRSLAAVAAGACDSARSQLSAALASVSPFFPAAEARRRIESCAARPRTVSEAR